MLKLKEDTVITAGVLRELCQASQVRASVLGTAFREVLDEALKPELVPLGRIAERAYSACPGDHVESMCVAAEAVIAEYERRKGAGK